LSFSISQINQFLGFPFWIEVYKGGVLCYAIRFPSKMTWIFQQEATNI